MTSIYDMMGRYTLPSVRDDSPFEHVEKFFQVKHLLCAFLILTSVHFTDSTTVCVRIRCREAHVDWSRHRGTSDAQLVSEVKLGNLKDRG